MDETREPIVYIDHSTIREGALAELKEGVRRLVEFIEAREPQLISYGFHIDEETTEMTVVAVHPDMASLEFHMEVGREEFRKLAPLLSLRSIEVYGTVGESALAQLGAKASMLGTDGKVTTIPRFAGFARLPSSQ